MFDFNSKGNSLLKDQLAESGLEMNIVITGSLALAGLSAGASIGQGIMGAVGASKKNAAARKSYQMQQIAALESATAQNEYNLQAFKTETENYLNNRKYEWETAVKNWQYQQEAQDFQYLQTVKQFGKSVENTQDQLTYNNLAAMQASEAEQASLNEIMNETAFNMQGALVEQLQAEGRAAMGQAGNSRNKAMQSTIAQVGRNAAIMDASLSSSVEQMRRNMRDISMRKYGADMQAKAAMMIEPEALPDIPKPTQPPMRIFMQPQQVMPQAVQKPQMQSVMAPLLGGFASAAGTLSKAQFAPKYDSQLKIPSTNYDISNVKFNPAASFVPSGSFNPPAFSTTFSGMNFGAPTGMSGFSLF